MIFTNINKNKFLHSLKNDCLEEYTRELAIDVLTDCDDNELENRFAHMQQLLFDYAEIIIDHYEGT